MLRDTRSIFICEECDEGLISKIALPVAVDHQSKTRHKVSVMLYSPGWGSWFLRKIDLYAPKFKREYELMPSFAERMHQSWLNHEYIMPEREGYPYTFPANAQGVID